MPKLREKERNEWWKKKMEPIISVRSGGDGFLFADPHHQMDRVTHEQRNVGP